MNKITITLTEDQAKATLEALETDSAIRVYGDGRKEHQAFMQRIIVKLAQALVTEQAKSL